MYKNIGEINSWANLRLRDCLKNQNDEFFYSETPYGLLGDIVAHQFEAINLWINRIEKKEPSTYIRRLKDFENINHLFLEWENADKRLEDFITNYLENDKIQDKILYKSSKGKQFENTVGEILFHISHHGYQHRSQVAMLLRLNEKQPMLPQDVIFYFRETK
ncbi:MAG: DinB family protein [Candidatus Hodarchaeales archaeon]|jgi:uncharacterized damage-inducible protein DinB